MSKLSLFALLLSLISLACDQGPYKRALDLNKKGTELSVINKDSALYYFDKAIAADSTYQLAIQNKANILIGQKKYTEALTAINQLLNLKSYPEALEIKGMLHEMLDQDSQAQEAYASALKGRKEKIKNSSKENLASENYALGFTHILLGDTILGKKLIQDNYQQAKVVISLKDSILKNVSDRQHLIENFLK